MGEMRKITVQVPKDLLENVQALSGEGVTETVREALKQYASVKAQQELRNLRGKVKFSLTLKELRDDHE